MILTQRLLNSGASKEIGRKSPNRNWVNSILVILVVLSIQFIIYLLVFRPHIMRWGANDYEVAMPMPGDKYSKIPGSTRAIDIHKPSDEVWSHLADLGADRKGFYSYSFLEYLYGCEFAEQADTAKHELYIGRIIPYTKPDSKGNYGDGFKVVEAVQGQSFVLQGWGGFLIKKTDENNSRLIIRTIGFTSNNVVECIGNSIFDMAHYIMEKRMMLGIKDNAESDGSHYNNTKDLIWFLCIFISGLAGLLLIIQYKGWYKKLYCPQFSTLFGRLWF
jgi:hypothetical protein